MKEDVTSSENMYSDVQSSQLRLDPFKVNKMDNKKLANSSSEEFEELYKVFKILCYLDKCVCENINHECKTHVLKIITLFLFN